MLGKQSSSKTLHPKCTRSNCLQDVHSNSFEAILPLSVSKDRHLIHIPTIQCFEISPARFVGLFCIISLLSYALSTFLFLLLVAKRGARLSFKMASPFSPFSRRLRDWFPRIAHDLRLENQLLDHCKKRKYISRHNGHGDGPCWCGVNLMSVDGWL